MSSRTATDTIFRRRGNKHQSGFARIAFYRDGDGYTLRLINNNGQEECAEFTVFGVKTKSKFGKFEVKTFEFKDGKINEREVWL